MDADQTTAEALADSDLRTEAKKVRAGIYFSELQTDPQRDLDELEQDVERQMEHWWRDRGR